MWDAAGMLAPRRVLVPAAAVLAAVAVAVATVAVVNRPVRTVTGDLTGARLSAIGDSLIKASKEEVAAKATAAGYALGRVDGINGIETIKRKDDLVAAVNGPDGSRILVVGLGTNNVHFASLVGSADIRAKPLAASLADVDATMEALLTPGATLECLVWIGVTTQTPNDGLDRIGPEFNDHVRSWVGPANKRGVAMRYADWDAYSRGHDDWFIADHIHFTAAGQQAYADLILATVRECTD